ncbi:mechanosensitive ion channel domain-containing protein [Desulfonatronospira sp.]|uniref:mechanosensitive ion channel family protein n=1 Tax=Desulfonatronospira sp. TaxID=1962951 RepID=UPI0025B969AE|nr:mechanosensitive ion channel domain-containing protein [Desulfonatronospira sp.]
MLRGVKLSFLPASIVLAVILLFLQPFSACAQSDNEVSPTADVSRAGVERLLQNLEDPQKLEELKQDLKLLLAAQENRDVIEDEEPLADAEGLVGQLLSLMSGHMQVISRVLYDAGQSTLEIPAFTMDLVEQSRDPEVLRSWGEMGGKVALVLGAGFLAFWLAQLLLRRPLRSLEDQEAYSRATRTAFLLGSTILELVPIIAFAAVAYAIMPLLDPVEGTRVVALTAVNAIAFAKLVLALARLVLVPGAPALRLVEMENETAQYLYIWVRRVVSLGIYGYFILEASLLLGMPASLYVSLQKLLGLIITLMAIILVMQNRSCVAKWLRGDPPPEEQDQLPESQLTEAMRRRMQTLAAFRRRLASFWHVLAIVIILGLFGTWALQIEGGLFFLARSLIVTGLIILITTYVLRANDRVQDYLFRISDELKAGHPELEARANRYLPLLKKTIRAVIYVLAVFSILNAWGLGTLGWLLSPQGLSIISQVLIILVILMVASLVWEFASIRIEKSMAMESECEDKRATSRKLTLLPLLRNVIMIAIILVAGMSVMSHLGINIAPLLAGAGVLGLAIGFGAQTLVRDVITGAFILLEDSMAVGDWVEAGGHAGTVEHLTVRTVSLRDLAGTLHVIPFGQVASVQNYNRDYGYAMIDAGVAFRENYGDVVHALQDVAAELKEDETWGPDIIGDLEIFGLNKITDSAVEVRVRIKTRPLCHFAIRRAFLERMKRVFDERGIEIPFQHHTIWFGQDKQGDATPMRVVHEARKSLPQKDKMVEPQPEQVPERKIEYFTESDASREVVKEKEQAEEEKAEEQRLSQEQLEQEQEQEKKGLEDFSDESSDKTKKS